MLYIPLIDVTDRNTLKQTKQYGNYKWVGGSTYQYFSLKQTKQYGNCDYGFHHATIQSNFKID